MTVKYSVASHSQDIPIAVGDRSPGVPGSFLTVIVKREKLVAWWPGGVRAYCEQFGTAYDDGTLISIFEMGGDGHVNAALSRFDELSFRKNEDYYFCDIYSETMLHKRPRTPTWLFSWLISGTFYFFRVDGHGRVPGPEQTKFAEMFKAGKKDKNSLESATLSS